MTPRDVLRTTRPTRPARASWLVALPVVALALTACSGDPAPLPQTLPTGALVTADPAPSSTAPTSAAAATTTAAAPTTSAAPTAAPASPAPAGPAAPPASRPSPDPVVAGPPAFCTAADLRASVGAAASGAGHTSLPLVLTNTGSGACRTAGFPGVSYVAGDDGDQVGDAAARTGTGRGTVVLAPGESASALVRTTDPRLYPAAECDPSPVRGFRVYPPDETAALFVPYPSEGCASGGVSQLEVQALVAGVTGGR